MAKTDKFMEGRNEGIWFAFKIAKNKGIDALEEEIRRRGIWGISSAVSSEQLYRDKVRITEMVIDLATLVSLITLHDEFGFGKERLKRFYKRFDQKTECLVPDQEWSISHEDYLKILEDECGVKMVRVPNGDFFVRELVDVDKEKK